MQSPNRKQMLSDDVRTLTLRIAAPSMIAMIATSVCSLFDALLLSRLGTEITAAVGLSFSLLTMIQAIGFTLGMGAGSFVSRSLGRGEREEAQRAASTALYTALLLGGGLCALGFFFPAPLLTLLGATPAVLNPAVAYARYVLGSGPMLCASLVLSSLLRGQGQTLPNMAAFAAGAGAGLLLQWLLVGRLALGITGAGLAMIVREALTLIILIAVTAKNKALVRPSLRLFSPGLRVYGQIMRSGLPTLLRQGLMSVSSVMLSRISAGFGETALAGMGLAVRAGALVSSAVIGFGQGFQPVCGFAYGAGRMGRVRDAYVFCQKVVTGALLALGAAVFVFSRPLLMLFGPEPAVADFGAAVLRAQSATFFAQGAVIMMNMLTQAMGLTVRASLVATSRQGYVFIPLVLLLPRFFGETGLILAQSASDIVSLLLCWLLTRGVTGSACERRECSDARTACR